MAGFKYKKFTVTGGNADFPVGSTDANIRLKEETIMNKFAQALIDCNCGWELDGEFIDEMGAFMDVPIYGTTATAPGYFFKNTTSGARLFATYVSGTVSGGMCFYSDAQHTAKVFDDSQMCTVYHSSRPTGNTNLQGFIMSMIPPGEEDTWLPFLTSDGDGPFIPASATRLCGTAVTAGTLDNSSNLINIAKSISNGITITFQVFATDECVGIGFSISMTSSGNPLLGYFCGKILGDLSDVSGDTSIQSKYGVFSYRRPCSSSSYSYDYITDTSNYTNTGWHDVNVFTNTTSTGLSLHSAIGMGSRGNNSFDLTYEKTIESSRYARSTTPGNSCCLSDGTWITNTSTHGVTLQINASIIIGTNMYDATSNKRPWVPIAMIIVAASGETEIAGVKGYLDTNLFRAMPQFDAGTVLDNGNFVCTGQGDITLGWDPTNESW